MHTSQHRWLHCHMGALDMAGQQQCICCGTPASHSADALCLQQCSRFEGGAFYGREEPLAKSMASCNLCHQHASAPSSMQPASEQDGFCSPTQTRIAGGLWCLLSGVQQPLPRRAACSAARCQGNPTQPNLPRSLAAAWIARRVSRNTGCADCQRMMENMFSCVPAATGAACAQPAAGAGSRPHCQAMRRTYQFMRSLVEQPESP